MAGLFVFGSRVAETGDQAYGHDEWREWLA
jgi:hypothetical protein